MKPGAWVRARPTYANVTATLALFLALGGGAYAASGGLVASNGVIHACVARDGGLVVVASGKRCAKGTRGLAFNQSGPRGNPGVQGVPGASGSPNSNAV